MQSFSKKIKTVSKVGIDPYIEGKRNFKKPTKETEQLAINRSDACKNCVSFTDEPIDFFRVVDKKIPILSNKMCDDCGCTLSYKVRQSIEKCDKWQE